MIGATSSSSLNIPCSLTKVVIFSSCSTSENFVKFMVVLNRWKSDCLRFSVLRLQEHLCYVAVSVSNNTVQRRLFFRFIVFRSYTIIETEKIKIRTSLVFVVAVRICAFYTLNFYHPYSVLYFSLAASVLLTTDPKYTNQFTVLKVSVSSALVRCRTLNMRF